MNWSSPNAALQAHDVARALILELVGAYQANGNAALGEYDDRGEPLLVAEEFRALLTSGDLLPLPVPGLMAYLEEYPLASPPAPRISSTGRRSISAVSRRCALTM